VNELGEWESESEQEADAPLYDEEIENDENEIHLKEGEEIQPNEGDNNCFVSRRVYCCCKRGE